ncbi:MAG: T9SS type A sorting domain-containing protein [Cyclobacteriaceae bacterium]|nr:T9SS type A sorting domain-containing protein [Cyclobacteriaceae bacterium]
MKIDSTFTKPRWLYYCQYLLSSLVLMAVMGSLNAQPLVPAAYYPAIGSTVATTSGVSLRYNTTATMGKGSGNITVFAGGLWQTIPVSSSNVTIQPASSPAGYWLSINFTDGRPLPDGTAITVNVPASAINTNWSQGFSELFNTWNFNTQPSGPILFSRTPAIGSAINSATTTFSLEFHENILKGSGSIVFKNKDTNAVLHSIDVTSSAVTILSGRIASITLPSALPQGVNVILEMASGVFKDAGNTNSIAVNDNNTWFTVVDNAAPQLLSTNPAHQSMINVADRTVTLTFNEPVVKGTGAIAFVNQSNGSTIFNAPLFGGDVTYAGNSITIVKPTNWPFNTQVGVNIPATAVKDGAGNFWPGITGANFSFSTCTSATPTVSIAVTGGTNPTCAGQSITFTATPGNGGTTPVYQWRVNGANVGTNSPTFTSSTLTNGQVVSCVLTSNATCTTAATATSNNITVGITPVVTPTVTITGNTTTCSGNSVTFNAAVTNAGSNPTYQWKVNGANVGSNQNFFTTNTLTNGQIVTCQITRDNSGCITTTTATSNALTMVVGTMPAQPSAITGNAAVCQGTTVTYSVTNVAGVNYAWDAGGGGTISGSGNSVSVTWLSTGTKTLSVYPINACGTGTPATLSVTINATPSSPGTVAGANAVGQNQANQYSVTNQPGVTYAWSAGAGGTVTGSGNSVSITWTTAGSKTITVTPSNSCGTGAASTLGVSVGSCAAPAQPSTISGAATTCVGGSGTYSVSSVGGVNYAWDAGAGGNVSGSGNSVTLTWSTPGTKTITVTPFTDCGTGTPRTTTVVVSTLPDQPSAITGNTTACISSTVAYSVTNVPGTTYTWDTGGKGTVTGTGNNITVQWTAAGTNSLTVTPSNSCGTGLARTLSVVVNNVPLGTSAITGANLMCTGTSSTYSVTNTSGVTYVWNAGAGSAITGTGNSVSITWSTGGEKVVQVTPSNACGNGVATTYTVSVTPSAAQPGTITGSTSVNAGTTNTYSVPNVAGINYAWSTNADGVIVGSGNSVQVSWTAGGTKTLTVTPSNACGNGPVRDLTVNVATPCVIPSTPSVIIMSGSANTTVNQTLRFQVTFSSGATSNDLTVVPLTGVTLTPVSGNTWDATFSTAGKYTVVGKGVSACGSSGLATLDINVCALSLDPPASVTGPTENVCPGSTTRYVVNNPVEGYSYDWSFSFAPGLVTYLNAQRTVADITWTISGANVTVRSRNACNNTSTFGTTISVGLASAPITPSFNVSPAGGICTGNTVTYTITNPEAGVDYNWNLNGAGTVAGNKLSATVLADGQARTIKVLATKACFVNQEVNSISFGGGTPTPAQPSPVNGPATINFNTDGTFSVEAQPAGVSFNWSAGGDATITNTASPNSKLIRWSTGGTKTIGITTSNSCGISSSRTYSLFVFGPCEAPAIPDPITGPSSGCANLEYTFSVPFQPNTTYNWSAGGDATITGSGTTRTIKWSTAGSKTISVSATNGCTTSAAQTKGFVIISVPAQPAALTGGSSACAGATEEFLVNPTVGGVTYAWEVQGGTFTTSGTQSERINITWSSAGTNVIKVKASNSCGFGPERSITRVIETTPLQPSIITGEQEVCTATSKTYSITNVPGTTYVWNGGAGATVTGSGNAVTISWSTTGAKTITVTPSNACGNGSPRTLSVNVIGVPSQPSAISGSSTPVLGNVVAYSVTNVTGVNYTWALSDKGVLTASGNTSAVTWSTTGSATLSVTPSNQCGAGTIRSQAITINKIPQLITFTLASPVLADANISLNSVSDSGLPVSYSSSNTTIAEVAGNQLIIKGTGTVNITASQGGDAVYAAATNVVRSLTINKASQTITFATPAAKVFTDEPFDAGASVNSPLALTYSSSNTAVATVTNNGTVTITGVGTTSITASQGGDALYNAATPVSRTLTVNKAAQTIAFEAIPAKSLSDPPFQLNATASSGLAVTYSSSNPAVAEVIGNTVIVLGNGSTIITAAQTGNANYLAATPVAQTLVVSDKQNQTISFAPLTSKTVGDAPFVLNATASSGLAVTYTSSNTSIATVSGNTVTLLSAGSVTIHANQPGNATFNAAPQVSQTFCVNPAKPTITASGLNTTTPILTSSSVNGNQWYRNNELIAGATGTTLTIAEPGVYKVQVSAGTCTSAFSEDFALIVTGDLNSTVLPVSVYPNPTTDRIQIDLPNDDQLRDVAILNLQGQPVSVQQTRNASLQLDVTSYAPGTYIVRVVSGKQQQVMRFIKK